HDILLHHQAGGPARVAAEAEFHKQLAAAGDDVKAADLAQRAALASASADLAGKWQQMTWLLFVSCLLALVLWLLVVLYRRALRRRRVAEHALQQARAELEMRVHERTAELRTANASLARAVQEHRETEERFRQMAETIHDVFWMRDVAGDRLLYV